MKRTFNVLLVEDDLVRKDRFLELWTAAFESAGVDAKIDYRSSFATIETDLKARPHIAIFDNVFTENGLESDNLGVEQIAKYKGTHSDTVFALYSGATFSIDQLGVRQPNPDLLITKTYMASQPYQKFLGESLADRVARMPLDPVVFEKPRERTDLKDKLPELQSIVEQCLHGFWNAEIGDDDVEVRLKSLTGGFSGSRVFELRFFGATRFENIPFVLKFSERRNVRNEAVRYNSFVRLQLPHDMRVDLIGYGEAGDHAGVCYAFAMGQSDHVVALTEKLKAGDLKSVEGVVEHVLTSDRTRWYKPHGEAKRLDDFFSNAEEYAPSKDAARLEGFRKSLGSVGAADGKFCKVTDDEFQFGAVRTPSIRRILAKRGADPVEVGFVHGDLNANNVFLSGDDGRLAMIDFEYSGEDHVYKDFISLESSIRLDFQSKRLATMPLERLIADERALLQNCDVALAADAVEYLAGVQRIRQAAVARLEKPIARSYAIGLGLHSLKLLRFTVNSIGQQRALCAAVFASALTADS